MCAVYMTFAVELFMIFVYLMRRCGLKRNYMDCAVVRTNILLVTFMNFIMSMIQMRHNTKPHALIMRVCVVCTASEREV